MVLQVRRKNRINARSTVKILIARSDLYAAFVDEKVCMKIGPGDWSPNRHKEHDLGSKRWEVCSSGNNYAVWRQE